VNPFLIQKIFKFFIMKKVFSFKTLSILFAIATAFAITQACVKKEDLTKDFQFSIDADIIKIPLSIQIIDGNFEGGANPANVTIELAGPNKDKFYSSIGKKDLTVVGGIVDLAMKKTDAAAISAQNPLTVTVIAKATGYLRTMKTYTLYSADTTVFEAISMVNMATPPKGVSIKTASVTVDAATGAAATTIVTTPNASTEAVSVQIPAGTQFKDKDGNVLTGTAEATLVHFDNQNPASLAAFPGGLAVNAAKDVNGTDIGAGQFTTMGFLALDMTIGGKEVKNFSGTGIQVSMELNEGSINPETGNPVAIGDQLPIWSLNETDGSWVREKVGTVSGTAGNLKLVYTQNHLSYWNLDYHYGPRCTKTALITFAGVTAPGNYFVEMVNATTNQVFRSFSLYLANGQTIGFNNAPAFNVYFRVSAGLTYYCAGGFVGKTNTFPLCGGAVTATFNATPPAPAPVLNVIVTVSGNCPNNPNVIIRPNAAVYYRKTGCPYWLPAGALVGGVFQSALFAAGQTYDFKAIVGTTTIAQSTVLIPATAVGTYRLDIRGTIPTSLCP
jgi:hypothetical protein